MSLPPSALLNREGATKSRAVKVPDFLSACLNGWVSKSGHGYKIASRGTHGLGRMARSSYDDASGTWAGTVSMYGFRPPCGVSGRPYLRS